MIKTKFEFFCAYIAKMQQGISSYLHILKIFQQI